MYVGKAKNLKKRVAQYFGQDKRPQLPFLIEEATHVDYIVSHTELESLFLENTLIKQHRPKYNIKLKDDKNYAFIAINFQTTIPQIGYVRSIASTSSQDFTNPSASWGARAITKLQITKNKSGKSLKAKKLIANSYYGPYSSAKKIKDILELTRNIFPYCSNTEVTNRPCFYYHLHRCPGVCIGKISLEEYQGNIRRIQLFLSGKFKEAKKELNRQMKTAASKKQFELAARLRDQLRALEALEQKQSVQFTAPVSYDFIATANSPLLSAVNLLKVREGKLVDQETFFYQPVALPEQPLAKQLTSPTKHDQTSHATVSINHGRGLYEQVLITQFCENYYQETTDLPKSIYLETTLANPQLLLELFKKRGTKKITITSPRRGKAKKLISLSKLNAEDQLRKNLDSDADNLDKISQALTTLKEVLELQALPGRIECYDISNIQGTNPVSSMVVFVEGKPAKSQYRKFKIQVKDTPDDFAMMHETISRRLRHLENLESGIENLEEVREKDEKQKVRADSSELKAISYKLKASPWPRPDLIVIDGGKGQLGAALKAAKSQALNTKPHLSSEANTGAKGETNSKHETQHQNHNLKASSYKLKAIPMIGLAKRIEEIFVPGKKEPIVLPHSSPALQLLQRLRDEAHRFAITFHKARRSKAATRSALDDIPGIGPKTKKLLKKHFGTVANIKKANPEELEKVVGKSKANVVKSQL